MSVRARCERFKNALRSELKYVGAQGVFMFSGWKFIFLVRYPAFGKVLPEALKS